MKKLLPLLITILFIKNAFAQDATTLQKSEATGTSHYRGIIEFGYLYGKSSSNGFNSYAATPTVQVFNGYQFHRAFALGATIGADFYNNVLITPIALGIRGELLKTRVSPFYSLDAGYGSAAFSNEGNQRDNEGGWMFSPAVGMRVSTGTSTAFAFSIGYKTQRVRTQDIFWGTTLEQKINYKRLTLRMGFMF
ncbi:hypothetical protein [Pontibacter harenae]|uniref:hypothetical protein n=1 Tax=Pontibacter harenae TaxID=2894083 RepID=UPI001E3D2BCF|nr:hypothetical protein [Pontibacter harenae]MCC9166914.1 hypothetical protein [Pontibacter harenae]